MAYMGPTSTKNLDLRLVCVRNENDGSQSCSSWYVFKLCNYVSSSSAVGCTRLSWEDFLCSCMCWKLYLFS